MKPVPNTYYQGCHLQPHHRSSSGQGVQPDEERIEAHERKILEVYEGFRV
jgi:hypothetical protein